MNRIGISVMGQTADLAPADKKLYALRDVTATVDSIPLIAASIMSKKIAAGSDRILLDVKTGSGAFMKTLEDSIALAKEMVSIGEHVGRRTVALITDMDRPLGCAIGNALEVREACETLQGRGPADLTEVCIELAANMLWLAEKGELAQCRSLAKQQIANGEAFAKLKEMVQAQGGDTSVLDDPSRFDRSNVCYEVLAQREGFLYAMDTERCGIASMELGAGREKKEDPIDYSAGIVLRKKVGDFVRKGEVLASFYSSEESKCRTAEQTFTQALRIQDARPKQTALIYARVTAQGVEVDNRS